LLDGAAEDGVDLGSLVEFVGGEGFGGILGVEGEGGEDEGA